MDASIEATVKAWQDNVTDPDLAAELAELVKDGNEDKLFDAFYRDLAFGTAGLRGTLGVGTNRMNVYVVAQATQGVADYLNAHYENPTLALARDSRNKGEDFQKVAAGVLAANGIHVYVYPRIEPVPTLSFAVRHLGTSAGIVLTASHNPAPYNGYKVYNDNGGQITDEAAAEISANIAKADPFNVKIMDFDEGLEKGLIEWTPEEVLDAFIENIKKVSVPGFKASDDYSVVYTPLNGTGMELVTRILKEIGVEKVSVVPEQSKPDGNFRTATSPPAPIPTPSSVRRSSLPSSSPRRSSPTSSWPPTPTPTAWAPPSRTTATTSCSPATRWASCSWTGSLRWPRTAARTLRPRWPCPRSSPPPCLMPLRATGALR